METRNLHFSCEIQEEVLFPRPSQQISKEVLLTVTKNKPTINLTSPPLHSQTLLQETNRLPHSSASAVNCVIIELTLMCTYSIISTWNSLQVDTVPRIVHRHHLGE